MSDTSQTLRSRRYWKHQRPDLDRQAVRYFVYFLIDADGVPAYIGRSCNVRNRIGAHYRTLNHAGQRSATWILDVRSVQMVGPFTWDEAVRREREEIERHQPRGNLDLTARDHRPYIAVRSASRAGR